MTRSKRITRALLPVRRFGGAGPRGASRSVAATGGGGVSAAGSSAKRIPIAGSTGSVGHASGNVDGLSADALWLPATMVAIAATAPESAVLHSANSQGSGR